MARSYPRFLFSNPTNTKTTGPFITHCIFPKGIIKVSKIFKDAAKREFYYAVKFIEVWDHCASSELQEVEERAGIWLKKQVDLGEIDHHQIAAMTIPRHK